eukprot:Hpha_TRINITY_DN16395_c1_g6::TRINITY_DN16395_c1_g6_i2::g.60505::m.60505
MGGCCSWGWLVRQGDTPDEAKIKTLMFPFALFMLLFGGFLVYIVLQTTRQMVVVIGNSIVVFATVLFMGGVASNAIPAGYLLDVLLVLTMVGICSMDLGTVTDSYPFRAWAFVVLVLDGALVFKRNHMPYFIIPLVLLYIAALQVESVSRFGLYEAG